MKFKEAQLIRDSIFKPLVSFNLEGAEPLIASAFVVPADEQMERETFIIYMQSEHIIEEAEKLGINPDDKAYGAMGLAKMDDIYDYTIMLGIYKPGAVKLEMMLARDYEGIIDLVTTDVLNKL